MELLISQRETVNVKWSDICEVYNVPKKLKDHQADAISLISAREHTFCGLPTGSGKTLAEVATVLFTKGTALVIPPLLTIEKQMCDVCDDWQISYLNLQREVLVCTDVAGMGVDIQDSNFSLNLGIPKNCWKAKQQSGRISRSGTRALNITVIFPQKGVSAPEPILRQAMRGIECIRKAVNGLFVLSSPVVDYTVDTVQNICDKACTGGCQCHLCICCSACSVQCTCSAKISDLDEQMVNILGFGIENYRKVKDIHESLCLSDESYDSYGESDENINEEDL